MEPIALFSFACIALFGFISYKNQNYPLSLNLNSNYWGVTKFASLFGPFRNPFFLKPKPIVMAPQKIESEFIIKARVLAERHIKDETFSVSDLAKKLRLSRSQAFRKIKEATGNSPSIFLRKIRLQMAKKLLLSEEITISEVAYQVGFKDVGYFSRCFSNEFRMTPSKLRKELKK